MIDYQRFVWIRPGCCKSSAPAVDHQSSKRGGTTQSVVMGGWQQAAESWVRHANGIYYLRAKALGKVIRDSLKTKI